MRVLICHRPGGAFGYISDGWCNALADAGMAVVRWDGTLQSWQQFDPDLYIGCSGHKQPIPANRRCKVAIHVNPWGPVAIKGINENDDNIAWTLARKPDCVFGYGFERDRLLWSYWPERGRTQWVPMPTAGDAVVYAKRPSTINVSDFGAVGDGTHDDTAAIQAAVDATGQRTLDVGYVGGFWPYKSKSLNENLLPVVRDQRIKASVHGWGDWPKEPWFKGEIGDTGVVHLYHSSLVVPCISEPHTLTHGLDLPERMFKAALCGALPIHDQVPTLRSSIRNAVVTQNPKNFLDLCVHYSRPENAGERARMALALRSEVLSEHTYHHRMATLLTALGFTREATAILSRASGLN